MICKRTGAILNNQGVSGSVVFGDTFDQNSAMKQLERLDRDIDYLIVFTGTNGARLRIETMSLYPLLEMRPVPN